MGEDLLLWSLGQTLGWKLGEGDGVVQALQGQAECWRGAGGKVHTIQRWEVVEQWIAGAWVKRARMGQFPHGVCGTRSVMEEELGWKQWPLQG